MPDAIRPGIDRIIQALDQELARLELCIDQTVEQHTVWRRKRDLLISMPGIGNLVASTLLGDLL